MTISYQWLSKYLPYSVAPEKLSEILTAIGLEVESMTPFQSIKGGLKGLLVGEILSCTKHPEADKLSLTTVAVGGTTQLKIVCGAANVAVGQKVVVAPVGCSIYPTTGEPFSIKKAKIRGSESEGMICAEDEIGLGHAHDGIMVLPPDTEIGQPISNLFPVVEDVIFEIGLTPNRMDAMSHLGVARDVCAWLSYHETETLVNNPLTKVAYLPTTGCGIPITLEAPEACKRYSAILIKDVTVKESPEWLRNHLQAIGLKPINNIVDLTNFILHETGQPLHAFDAAKIGGEHIHVRYATEGSVFITLDEKDRKLAASDLLIADARQALCLAGVYGGLHSGVTADTKDILLESACFHGETIRRTSIKHGLRTDAATRFEKGTDISNTVSVLMRAAQLMTDIAGGTLGAAVTDLYPNPKQKNQVTLPYAYLHKLSGKKYEPLQVEKILLALGFTIISNLSTEISLEVPFSKPDIFLPADIVEEIMRIDGLDQIVIPTSIRISPAVAKDQRKVLLREKISNDLVGMGFYEIFTNSISNSKFYKPHQLDVAVKMINSLSADLDIMRPDMIQSGLQVIAHNLNRKNQQLRFFEFGKTYFKSSDGKYEEKNNLVLYVSGTSNEPDWKNKAQDANFYYLKGLVEKMAVLTGIEKYNIVPEKDDQLESACVLKTRQSVLGRFGAIKPALCKQFEVKQPVFYAHVDWDAWVKAKPKPVQYREISKFPAVNRDLSLVVDQQVSYHQVAEIAMGLKINEMVGINPFDVFESDKLGVGKKSLAVSFTFQDGSKTLTDEEIDTYMKLLIEQYETKLGAEIRK